MSLNTSDFLWQTQRFIKNMNFRSIEKKSVHATSVAYSQIINVFTIKIISTCHAMYMRFCTRQSRWHFVVQKKLCENSFLKFLFLLPISIPQILHSPLLQVVSDTEVPSSESYIRYGKPQVSNQKTRITTPPPKQYNDIFSYIITIHYSLNVLPTIFMEQSIKLKKCQLN